MKTPQAKAGQYNRKAFQKPVECSSMVNCCDFSASCASEAGIACTRISFSDIGLEFAGFQLLFLADRVFKWPYRQVKIWCGALIVILAFGVNVY